MTPRVARSCVLLALFLVLIAWWSAESGSTWWATVPPDEEAAERAEEDPSPRALGDPGLRGRGANPVAGGTDAPNGPRASREAETQDEGEAPEVTLRIDTVDARTGARLPAQWNVGTGRVVGGPFWKGQVITPELLETQRRNVEASVARWEAAFVDSGETHAIDAWVDDTAPLPITVRPPTGYVLLDQTPGFAVRLAHGVRAAQAVIPLWPEAVLDVRVLGPDGLPAAGAVISQLQVAGRARHVAVEVRSEGELRVRNLPFLPGEAVVAHVECEWGSDIEEEIEEEVQEVLEEGPGTPDLRTVVPATLTEPWTTTVRLKAPRIRDSVETDNDLPYEESFGQSEGLRDAPSGSVRVRVVDWEGEPIAGAGVRDGVTDERGEVLFEGLPVGALTLRANAAGRLPAEGTVLVGDGEEVFVELREPLGARLEVVVLDADGRAVPFARLAIRRAIVFDVVEDVQRLDTLADARGRRTFARVELGKATIIATWGSHVARREIELGDRRTLHLELSP